MRTRTLHSTHTRAQAATSSLEWSLRLSTSRIAPAPAVNVIRACSGNCCLVHMKEKKTQSAMCTLDIKQESVYMAGHIYITPSSHCLSFCKSPVRRIKFIQSDHNHRTNHKRFLLLTPNTALSPIDEKKNAVTANTKSNDSYHRSTVPRELTFD